MNQPLIPVFGGTSDARQLCQMLDDAGIHYQLSVATEAGVQQAQGLRGEVVCGRMDRDQMVAYFQQNSVQQVIDVSHPYAAQLSQNVYQACHTLGISLIRYERASEIHAVQHPLVHQVTTIEQACELAKRLGKRVLLTTGSKQLADYVRLLTDMTVMARVLPTSEVLALCESCGLTVDQILALKGPFSADFNRAMYQFCQADVVITKESGAQGGFQQKVEPCLTLGIPCIIVCRPSDQYDGDDVIQVQSLQEIKQLVTQHINVARIK
ncbi:MAG: cobalt-precorrin-6A reductase [Enterobacteriaceae bacterium]|nr:cobalt-precorrin-6A reductase [Enterobacteriaceae bacterium]